MSAIQSAVQTVVGVSDSARACVKKSGRLKSGAKVGFRYDANLYKPPREFWLPPESPEFKAALRRPIHEWERKWTEQAFNLIPNEGLDHILDVWLSGGTQDTSWFMFLLGSSPSPAAGWTATEVGSNDFVNYDESTLQAFTDGGVSSQSLDNSASPAVFTIDTNSSTIGGSGLIGTNAKATPAGTVCSAAPFSGGNKSADDNDTLTVTGTLTTADDGA